MSWIVALCCLCMACGLWFVSRAKSREEVIIGLAVAGAATIVAAAIYNI